jgi:formylglycine-generating enzyme required for sulfatase activity
LINKLINQQNADPAVIQALVLAIGEHPAQQLAPRDALLRSFHEHFENHDDPGVHAALQWALMTGWGSEGQKRVEESTNTLRMLGSSRLKGKSSFTRQWFVEPRAGITLVYIPKNATFRMGNIDFARNRRAGIADDGKLGSIPASVTIPRGFLISMTEITESQFAELGKMPARTEPEGPAFGIGAVTWSEAASFCNRLTQAESQYCYKEVNPPDLNGAITFDGVNEHLSLEGYRLPTEAEWEYTCRGGTNTPFSYGTDPEMLPLYAWIGDSRDEVGSLRPNSF